MRHAIEAAAHAKDVSVEKAKEIAQDVDKNVHQYPWAYIGGTAVVVGIPPEGSSASFDPLVLVELDQRILGSNYGGIRPGCWITCSTAPANEQFPLTSSNFWRTGFAPNP